MKQIKKIIALLLCLTLVFALAACGGNSGEGNSDGKSLKVGLILVGDETEGYTKAHMDGVEKAVKELEAEGINVTYEYKKKVQEDETVATNASDLIADGCTLVVTNSYGHQEHWGDVIKDNPDVNFVSMTGDKAAGSGLSNYYNAFTNIYEARYVSGIVAGMKIKELVESGKLTPETTPNAFDENGNVKVGYVGAFNYAEVVSGYTAFFLGIQSVYPQVSMTVKYTNSWFSEEREAAVAKYLMDQGCVIIGQHADSTGAPAAVEDAYKNNNNLMCYSVGYNVSMLDVAPDVALTSPTNEWDVYYKTLFKAAAEGKEIPQDWSEGFSEGAVGLTQLGTACAPGTQEAVNAAIQGLKDGTIFVFDCGKFTVNGQPVPSYTNAFGMDGQECMKEKPDGGHYFAESTIRSAPYFDIRIDGITEVDADNA